MTGNSGDMHKYGRILRNLVNYIKGLSDIMFVLESTCL
jgi:hypothetical protein